jgi:hypothetical protein
MSFNENGFYIIREFLDSEFVAFINQYFFTRINAGQATLGDVQAPNSYIFYGDPLMDTILGESVEELAKIAGYKLLPTYTYTRLYGKGDELKIHRDRSSCELSGTLALGVPSGEDINPIYFSKNEDKTDVVEIKLNPGDLCLYRGCDLYHWRPPFTQKWYLQAFLHYVDADGPHKDFIYDKRPYLGMNK